MQHLRWILLVLVALMPCAASAAELSDPSLGFTMTIPDEFAPDAKLAAAGKDFVHAYRRPGTDGLDTVIVVERLRGTIGREKLDPKLLPAGSAARLITLPWGGLDIEGFEVPEPEAGVINYNAQVPLKREAIQLRVMGDARHAAEIRALTTQLLAGLRGDSNWLRSAAPVSVARMPGYGMIILLVLIAGVVSGVTILWIAGRRSRRGTMLGLAGLVYVAAIMIGPGETREQRGLKGGMQMCGSIGILLGLVDLVWHPDRRKKPVPPPPLPAT